MIRPAIVMLAMLCGACQNDVLDGQCTPATPNAEVDPDCPYAEHISRGYYEAEKSCVLERDEPDTDAGWDDVYAILTDPARGNCTHAGCHGDPEAAAIGIYLPSDEQDLYRALTETTGTLDRPYVNPADPHASWIHCSVAARSGGGYPMPKPGGLPAAEDARLIEDWVLAGVPGP